MGVHGKGTFGGVGKRRRYKNKDFAELGQPYANKIGMFERGLENDNLGIFAKAKRVLRKRRWAKALQEIIEEVNTIPRGLGILPQNKTTSLNGYYNFMPEASLAQNKEWLASAEAKEVGIGNSWQKNKEIYYSALQCIKDGFYKRRHFYKGDPELEAEAKKEEQLLILREDGNHYRRVKGYNEEIVRTVEELDQRFGLPVIDVRFKEADRSGINPVLERAQRELKLEPQKIEKLKVYLLEKELYFLSQADVEQDLKGYLAEKREEFWAEHSKPREQREKLKQLGPKWRGSESFFAGVAPVLTQAEKELRLDWDTAEALRTYLSEKKLYLVPRQAVLLNLKSAEERSADFRQYILTKGLEESDLNWLTRLQDSMAEKEARQKQGKTLKESLDIYTKRAVGSEQKSTALKRELSISRDEPHL